MSFHFQGIVPFKKKNKFPTYIVACLVGEKKAFEAKTKIEFLILKY